MACPYSALTPDIDLGGDDEPALLWAVCRRDCGPGQAPLWYCDSVRGWSPRLSDAYIWPSLELASAVAAIFDRAAVVRILYWRPLPTVAMMEDIPPV